MSDRFLSDRLLFWAPTLIWATTWHVILFQFGDVAVQHSIALRFGLASALLFGIARWRGESLAVPLRLHGWLLLTGTIQYGLNYMGTYNAEQYVPSGLVAVTFSLMIFTNAYAAALFFGQPVTRRFLGYSVLGVCGTLLIFWPDIAHAEMGGDVIKGLGFALAAMSLATLGNILTLRITRQGMPLIPALAWSMGYGAAALMVMAAVQGIAFVWDPRPSYWLALFYLSALGSVAAFLLYFKLAQRKGAGHAALTGMVIPVLALVVSAIFEGWHPTPLSMLGVVLSLAGLWGATRRAN